MSAADRERARLSLARGGGRWVRHDRHEVDVEMLEDRVKDFRWCAYTKNFVHISTFSNEQRAKPANNRFCQTYSNHQKRASMNPSIEMTDEVLREHCERACVIINGFNETLPAVGASQRAVRAAGRQDSTIQQLVDEAEEEHAADGAEQQFEEEEDEEAEADANGASSSRLASKRRRGQRQQTKDARRRSGMTDEQRAQSEADKAARKARLAPQALDEYSMSHLKNLKEYDEEAHTNELERDSGRATLHTWDGWEGWDNTNWTTALDDGSPSDERKEAARKDLEVIHAEQMAVASLPDAVERNVKMKLLKVINNRLMKIVAGTAGFTDLSRGEWRQQGCAKLVVDGTKHTCIQDALCVVARHLGVGVSKTQIYAALVDPISGQEAEIASVVCHAREQLGLDVRCLTHGSSDSLARRTGGIEYNTLQLVSGAYIIVLNAILEDGNVERHAMAYLADFKHPAYRGHFGALVDNDPRVDIRFLQPSDRASVQAARAVFNGLFWTAKRVAITSVWLLEKP